MALITFNDKNRNAEEGSHESELRDDDINELKAGITSLENFLVGTGNTVIVDSKSDFPSPVAGVITLLANVTYRIVGTVNIGTDRIDTNGGDILGSVSSPNTGRSILTYTGTSSMITVGSNNFTTGGMVFNCTSGDFLDFNGSGSEILKVGQCDVYSKNLGDIASASGVLFSECVLSATTTGFTMSGANNGRIDFARIWSNTVAGTFLDLGTSILMILNISFVSSAHGNGEIFMDGLAAGGNFTNNFTLSNNTFTLSGTGKVFNNITVNDLKVLTAANSGLQDTHHTASIYVADGDEIDTIIGAASGDAGNPIQILGTFTEDHMGRFTSDAAGTITYHDGGDAESFRIHAAMNSAPISGTNIDFAMYIALNGVVITASRDKKTASSGSPQKIICSAEVDMVDGDYIQIFIENLTNTTNFETDSVKFSAEQ